MPRCGRGIVCGGRCGRLRPRSSRGRIAGSPPVGDRRSSSELLSSEVLGGTAMSNDAIVVLKDDHKRIRALFKEFQSASQDAHVTQGKIVEQIIGELTVHTYLENEVMYPQVRQLVPDLEQDVLESYEEHHVADLLCVELMALEPTDEHFQAKATVLIENVTHHIEEEEQDWFPKVREALGRKQLTEIGERMQELRASAPRHPAQPGALKKAVDALLS